MSGDWITIPEDRAALEALAPEPEAGPQDRDLSWIEALPPPEIGPQEPAPPEDIEER